MAENSRTENKKISVDILNTKTTVEICFYIKSKSIFQKDKIIAEHIITPAELFKILKR